MIEPEPVFGDIKNNRGFKRFLLRGLPKVSLEVGWLSLAHNLLKKAAVDLQSCLPHLTTWKLSLEGVLFSLMLWGQSQTGYGRFIFL
ncbi:hypothetical protein GGC63_000405 [Paenibacillus sp. OAS669]|nr:hypothetical protein [Paenibacillus sp. OAS669]